MGFDGWMVSEVFFESAAGERVIPVRGFAKLRETRLVLVVERRWLARCPQCGGPCHALHEQLPARRWADLPWAEHPVELRYAPVRVECSRCNATPVEMVAWADPYQRQTRRLQQRLAVEAASMPVMHVAALHGLSWLTVRRAEDRAIERWEATRPAVPLRQVGVDEKWLGRRHALDHKFVTIVSNLETGEPVWIGKGRDQDTLQRWLQSLSPEQKATIELFAMDMHRAYWNAVDSTRGLEHAAIVHDPFHIMKLAGQMLDELRREVFFRAGPDLRAIGRGKRWLLLRAWERTTGSQRADLQTLLSHNRTLARGYQIKEELRDVLHAPDGQAIEIGLRRILRRTARHDVVALRRLHDTLDERWNEIVALAEHRPPVGRLEALNNNWETLVRRARGYRDHHYLLRKLRFMTANPIRTDDGIRRFIALGITPPMARRQAA
ncbi:MAG TPA: ISL3 family transposase [Polyangiaceae bacterium]|nr:ISL3 family transposase [Polyangiaceae bacterium]